EPRPSGSDLEASIAAKSLPDGRGSDLSTFTPDELVDVLDHPNRWHRQTALRLIGDAGDASLVPRLRTKLLASGGRQPSEGDVARNDELTRGADVPRSPVDRLWALDQLGGLDKATALAALDHADPQVRSWTVRLTCDDRRVEPAIAERLAALAEAEPNIHVRVQLACSARRLPVEPCLAIVAGLLLHDADAPDPLLPLSLWWAVEAHCDAEAARIAEFFMQHGAWSRPLARDVFAERLMRRFASGNRAHLALCADLLRSAADDDVRGRMLAGFETAFRGRPAAAMPEELVAALAETGGLPLSLRVRRGEAEAIAEALQRVADSSVLTTERAELASLLGESRSPDALPSLLALFDSSDATLRQAGLAAIAGYDDATVGDRLLEALPQRDPAGQVAIVSVLVSRADWTRRLVALIEEGTLSPDVVPSDLVRRLTLHDDAPLTAAAAKLWPELAERETAAGRDVASLTKTIVADSGDPYAGRRLFLEACGRCHRLFGEGGEVGPDLTSDPRNDLSRLLGSIVKPSAEIREGFESWVAVTSEGRVISGLLIDQDEHVVVLRENDGRAVLLRRDELEDLVRQPQSLMPDRLLDRMTDQEVRDLVAYLRSSQPLNDAR
ncbi:MAG: dehydrogenase, partial [Planctomycetaceae bacterium]